MDPVSTTLSTLKGVYDFFEFSKRLRNAPKEVAFFEEEVCRLDRQLMVLRDLRTQLRNLPNVDHGQIRGTLWVEQRAWAMFIRIDNNVSQKMKNIAKSVFNNQMLARQWFKFFWVTDAKPWIADHREKIESAHQSVERRIQCVRGLLHQAHSFEENKHRAILPRKAMHLADMMHELSV